MNGLAMTLIGVLVVLQATKGGAVGRLLGG